MKAYGRRKGIRKRVYRKRKGASTCKVSKCVRKYVRNAIHRNIENKVMTSLGANQSIITAGTSNTPFFVNLLPSPSQGTGHAGRIGNEIRLTKAYIQGRINLLPYNATTNPNSVPVLVKMWLISNKINNNPSMAVLSTFTTFFDTGNVNSTFQSNPLDMILSPNKDAWTVYKTKSLKLGVASISATGPVTSNGYYDNSSMSVPFSFSISQHVKNLKFDDTSQFATNRNLYLLIQAVAADGTNSSALTLCECHYSIRWEYEDA